MKHTTRGFWFSFALSLSVFLSSAAYLFYQRFLSTSSGWVEFLNQVVAALAIAVLVSSGMVLIAISRNHLELKH